MALVRARALVRLSERARFLVTAPVVALQAIPAAQHPAAFCRGHNNLPRPVTNDALRLSWTSPGDRRSFSAATLPAHQEIAMPSLSPTMTQGNILAWKKNEGDKVIAGDVLAEIETDKATIEMESMEAGYVAKILVPAGSKDVAVGQTIVVVVENKEDVAAFASFTSSAKAAAASPPATAVAPSVPVHAPAARAAPSAAQSRPAASGGRVFVSPLAKKLAADSHVELSAVRGTGPGGRVVKADVLEAMASGTARAGAGAAAAAGAATMGEYVDLAHSNIRRITASRLLESKQTVPHYYLSVDVKMDALASLRTELNAGPAAGAAGIKLSVNDFVIKAAALALRKVPGVNSAWMPDATRTYAEAHIGVAVQTEHGLIVPVVRSAHIKGLAAISADVKQLAEKAKANKLKPAEFTGGTFTISNLGMFGVKQFCAIVNPPQAAILAVGGAEKRVVSLGKDTYGEATYMCATLSCDHRVVDGAMGATWLKEFKAYLEDPLSMLI